MTPPRWASGSPGLLHGSLVATVTGAYEDPLELKGKSGRISAYRLISVAGPVDVTSRFDAPDGGAPRRLRTLDEALRRAVRNRACVLATVLGPAGIGKSRLIQEFLERQPDEVTVARSRCLPYGEGIT